MIALWSQSIQLLHALPISRHYAICQSLELSILEFEPQPIKLLNFLPINCEPQSIRPCTCGNRQSSNRHSSYYSCQSRSRTLCQSPAVKHCQCEVRHSRWQVGMPLAVARGVKSGVSPCAEIVHSPIAVLSIVYTPANVIQVHAALANLAVVNQPAAHLVDQLLQSIKFMQPLPI